MFAPCIADCRYVFIRCKLVAIPCNKLPMADLLAFASIFVNTCYIILMMYATRMSIKAHHTQSVYVLAYILLIMSTTPTLLMLLCGLDYSLFEILSWYILLDMNKLMLPISTIVFLSVTYWLPVREIGKIQKTYEYYISIKNNNGK